MKKVLYHAMLILSLMYMVFFGIDRVNTAMDFIDNDITKYLMLLMALMDFICAFTMIVSDHNEQKRAWKQAQAAHTEK